jgi:hypothetical protein
MNALQFRTRVAVLWMAVAVATVAQMLLYFLIPGALEEMLAGQVEGEALTAGVGYQMALLVVIPLAMATMTLLARDRVNRYASLVVGLLVGLLGSLLVGDHLLDGAVNGHVLLAAVAVLLAFLIAGLSAAELRRPVSGPGVTAEEPTGRRHPATV